MLGNLLKTKTSSPTIDIALLFLRVGAGGLMLMHGWEKLSHFTEKSRSFYNFLGVGSTVSLSLTVFAEVFCALFIVAGLATRYFAFPLVITMGVAAFMVHGDDSLDVKELALLYFSAYCTLLLAGGGKYSVDGLIYKK